MCKSVASGLLLQILCLTPCQDPLRLDDVRYIEKVPYVPNICCFLKMEVCWREIVFLDVLSIFKNFMGLLASWASVKCHFFASCGPSVKNSCWAHLCCSGLGQCINLSAYFINE
jgi:hypothetical protein